MLDVQKSSYDPSAVAAAVDALKTFDWGKDPGPLKPIEHVVPFVHDDAESGKQLERQITPLLTSGVSLAAKDYVIRQLMVIATVESLPVLASLLTDKQLSHRARMVIERMPCEEAAKALRSALPKVSGDMKAGVIGSLGNRRDSESVIPLCDLVGDSDVAVASAAATALGDIGTIASAMALRSVADKAAPAVKPLLGDAMLACAERLLRGGEKEQALAVYGAMDSADLPKNVKNAAKRGKLMAM